MIGKPPRRGGKIWRKETLRIARRRRGRGKEKVWVRGWGHAKRVERSTRGRGIVVGHLAGTY